jgi:hypothetical protein
MTAFTCEKVSDCVAGIYGAFLFYVLGALFPWIALRFLYQNFSRLDEPTFKNRFGALYDGTEGQRAQIWYPFLFMIRR